MTPAHSECGEANSPGFINHDPVLQSSQSSHADYNMDMDEDDADVRSQPPESPAPTLALVASSCGPRCSILLCSAQTLPAVAVEYQRQSIQLLKEEA